MDVDLFDQWIRFCEHAAPGTRYWLNDSLFERLFDRLGREARFADSEPVYKVEIQYRGGYQHGGLSFYRRSAYPYPLRRDKTGTFYAR